MAGDPASASPTPTEAPDTPGVLRLEGVSAGDLSDVSFEIPPGEILGLSGPSGSGKSRLLRVIADLDAHQGEIRLGKKAQSAMRAHAWRARVMLVPSESQWWADTVGEHFPGRAIDGASAVGFDGGVGEWQVSRLSSGEKQRLGLLRALALRPAVLLLDEPTANLDPEATRRVELLLASAVREHRMPVLWVSHDLAQLERVATRRLEIAHGRLEQVA